MVKSIENKSSKEHDFSDAEIASFVQTMQDFKDGKTTTRDWTEIEKELGQRYNSNLPDHSI